MAPLKAQDGPDAIFGRDLLWAIWPRTKVPSSLIRFRICFLDLSPVLLGETSTFLILLGGLFLVFSKIASWRIMLSAVIGSLVMGLIFNIMVDAGIITEDSKFLRLNEF